MAVTRSRLLNGVRTLCGEPPDVPISEGGLPSSLIFEVLGDVEDSMLRDMNQSTGNRRVAKIEVGLTNDQDEFSIPYNDFHSPAYVYLQTDASTDLWYPVEIMSHASLGLATENGQLAVGFSGTPQTGYLSWIPDGSQTLRIWYERNGDDAPTVSGNTEVGALYDEYLKLQTAAQCREYMKLEIGGVMAARLVKSEAQWQRYVKGAEQRGLGFKAPVFPLPRSRRFTYLDRRRFFVP